MLLDHSATELTLRRVPPNLLVGQGATDWAWEHGMPVLSHDQLISPAARERWRRWSQDLHAAERRAQEAKAARYSISPAPSEPDYDPQFLAAEAERRRKSHTAVMSQGLYNEAQPLSPPPSDDPGAAQYSSSPSRVSSATSMVDDFDTASTTPEHGEEYTDPYDPPTHSRTFAHPTFFARPSANPFMNSSQSLAEANMLDHRGGSASLRNYHQSMLGKDELEVSLAGDDDVCQMPSATRRPMARSEPWSDGSSGSHGTVTRAMPESDLLFAGHGAGALHHGLEDAHSTPRAGSPVDPEYLGQTSYPTRAPSLGPDGADGDNITDTVGAIAIDVYGNIACGASSGGIGMKHRGRIGPAALVGIGACVIPADPDDPDRTSVATVTSGTGEHMGTTMASSVCSQRVFYSQRRTSGGGNEEVTEDEAIKGFIERDFMGHASVKSSQSAGAIGVLTVKKTVDGAWLYFGHNTDSFAIASMTSDDSKPSCTMSRSRGNGSIAQGGKTVRFRKRR